MGVIVNSCYPINLLAHICHRPASLNESAPTNFLDFFFRCLARPTGLDDKDLCASDDDAAGGDHHDDVDGADEGAEPMKPAFALEVAAAMPVAAAVALAAVLAPAVATTAAAATSSSPSP